MEDQIVFIGGAPRSGTTLLLRLLDSHPAVAGGPELNAIPDIVALFERMRDNVRGEYTSYYHTEEELVSLFRDFIRSVFRGVRHKYRVSHVCEKTPSNVLVFEELAELLPEARFLFVVRDPKDVASSYLRVKGRATERGRTVPDVAKNIFRLTDYIRLHMEAGWSFCDTHPERAYVVRYEELVQNTESTVRDLLSFLDLPYVADVLALSGTGERHRARRAQATGSVFYTVEEVSKEIDASSIGRWRGTLSGRQAALIDHVFRKTPGRGYAESASAGSLYPALYRLHRRLTGASGLTGKVARRLW